MLIADDDDDANNNDLGDNVLQKVTNKWACGRAVSRMQCLFDPATDGAIEEMLLRNAFSFGHMHSTEQALYIMRLRQTFFHMFINRLERLIQKSEFMKLLERHLPDRLRVVNEWMQHKQTVSPSLETFVLYITSTVHILFTEYYFRHAEVTRFMQLHHLLTGATPASAANTNAIYQ